MRKTLMATAILVALAGNSAYAQSQASSSNLSDLKRNNTAPTIPPVATGAGNASTTAMQHAAPHSAVGQAAATTTSTATLNSAGNASTAAMQHAAPHSAVGQAAAAAETSTTGTGSTAAMTQQGGMAAEDKADAKAEARTSTRKLKKTKKSSSQ